MFGADCTAHADTQCTPNFNSITMVVTRSSGSCRCSSVVTLSLSLFLLLTVILSSGLIHPTQAGRRKKAKKRKSRRTSNGSTGVYKQAQLSSFQAHDCCKHTRRHTDISLSTSWDFVGPFPIGKGTPFAFSLSPPLPSHSHAHPCQQHQASLTATRWLATAVSTSCRVPPLPRLPVNSLPLGLLGGASSRGRQYNNPEARVLLSRSHCQTYNGMTL